MSFQRIHLDANETRTLNFKIDSQQYALVNSEGQKNEIEGDLLVSVGGKQSGFKGVADANSTTVLLKKILLTTK